MYKFKKAKKLDTNIIDSHTNKQPKKCVTIHVTKKKIIPKAIRTKLWEDTFGDTLKGVCYVCDRHLKNDNFEAGHIIAEANGGKMTISNLKVVCKPCNQSCGTTNLEEFKNNMNWTVS